MKIGKILIIAFVVIMCITLISNLVINRAPQSPEAAPPKVSATSRPASYYTVRTLEMAADIVRTALPSATVSSRYNEELDIAYIELAMQEINADFVQNAQDGVGTCAQDWETAKDSLIKIQKRIAKLFREMNREDTTVVINLLDPADQSEVYLSIANGIAGYDVVNGINLLEDQSAG